MSRVSGGERRSSRRWTRGGDRPLLAPPRTIRLGSAPGRLTHGRPTPSRAARVIAWAGVTLWALATPFAARAADEKALVMRRQVTAFLESWRWRIFDRDDGLDSSAVTALYQDRETTKIYAATRLGVCLYDLWQWDVLEASGEPLTEEITDFAQSQNEVYALSTRILWKVQGGSRLRIAYRGDDRSRSFRLCRGRPPPE